MMNNQPKERLRQSGQTTEALRSITRFPAMFIVEHAIMKKYAMDLACNHLKVRSVNPKKDTITLDGGDVYFCAKIELEKRDKFRGMGFKQVVLDHYARDQPWTLQQRDGFRDIQAQVLRG